MTRLARWRDRRHRRPLVVALGAGLVTIAWLSCSEAVTDNTPLFAGVLLTRSSWLLLRVLTGGIAERTASRLDERERSLRGRYAYTASSSRPLSWG